MALAHGGFEVGAFRLAWVVHANKTHLARCLFFLYLEVFVLCSAVTQRHAAFRVFKGRWISPPMSLQAGLCPPDDRVLYAQLKSGLHIFLFSTGTQNRWFFLSFLVPGRYKTNRHHLNPGAAPKWAKTKNWLVKWVLIHTPLGIEHPRCFCVPTATSAPGVHGSGRSPGGVDRRTR